MKYVEINRNILKYLLVEHTLINRGKCTKSFINCTNPYIQFLLLYFK